MQEKQPRIRLHRRATQAPVLPGKDVNSSAADQLHRTEIPGQK
ncbi:MAG: hypothetical protein ACJAQZ_003920, partial [Planctomycetota bacterium]